MFKHLFYKYLQLSFQISPRQVLGRPDELIFLVFVHVIPELNVVIDFLAALRTRSYSLLQGLHLVTGGMTFSFSQKLHMYSFSGLL